MARLITPRQQQGCLRPSELKWRRRDQDRAWGAMKHALGHTPSQRVTQGGLSVRAHHDEVGFGFAGDSADDLMGPARLAH
jgi:hypothetical protein